LIGTRLLHYEVTAKLGEGGMGEVYRATDSKLGREVAIKVLPAAFVEDPERLARFEREARVLAALEHPNIAGIYGLEEADGKQLLVMQLASGEDLSARLARGAMPLEEVLPIALQITRALEAAHDRGIVHRDLKPANVMVAPDGAVKVLDFGLAKAWGDGGPGSDPNLTASPTLTAQMTQAGVILGTAGYMSPEQARGQEADRRSDIWSFGVVLHEMLTGKRLFQADTVSDTLARVLMAEPEWGEIDASLPAPISALLHRCLERDAGRRLQAIGEARIAIEDYLAHPEATAATTAPSLEPEAPLGTSKWLRAAPWTIVGVAVGWLLALGLSGPGEEPTASETLRFSIQRQTSDVFVAEDVNGVDISRDGRQVAFIAAAPDSSVPMIYLKTARDAEPRPLASTEDARNPFFSPDGEWLAYFTDRELRKIGLLGGSSMLLTPAQDRRGGVWGEDGYIYFIPHSTGPVMKIRESGGEVTAVTTLDAARRERTHRWPALLPGGKALLYTSDTHDSTEYYDDARIEVIDLETGEHKVVLEGSSRASWLPTGHLLFARDGSLYAAPFDLEELEVTGPPQLVLQDVSTIVASGAVQFAISADGSLAYTPGGKTTEVFKIEWLDETGATEAASSELGQFFQAQVSPSGDRIALSTAGADNRGLWVLDLERQVLSRLTFQGSAANPIWSSDGERILYASTVDQEMLKPYSKPADGSGDAELLWNPPNEAYPMDLSSDDRWLAVRVAPLPDRVEQGMRLWIVDLKGEIEPYEFADEAMSYVAFSPDDRYIAYISEEGGSPRVYVKPFPEGDGKWQVSSIFSREPRWTPDGKRLFYRTTDGLQYVDVDLSDGFRAGRPKMFEDQPGTIGAPFNLTYSFSPDSRRVLRLAPHVPEEQDWVIHVVLNWKTELEQLLGVS
jgi:serine/threonine-protein kinase